MPVKCLGAWCAAISVGIMDLSKIPLFTMLTERMAWLNKRQQVLAPNTRTPSSSSTSRIVPLPVRSAAGVRVFGARALRNKGYTVLEADSGDSALELVASYEDRLDLLISDVVMSRMDGPTLVRRVRQSWPKIKVILISGYAEDAYRESLDEAAEFNFLPKPFSLKQLAGTVKEVMSAAPS